MRTTVRAAGWYERAPRIYYYWDGGAWTARLPERRLLECRRDRIYLPGAPVSAPVHGRQPRPLFPRPGRRAAYTAIVLVVGTGLWFVNAFVAVMTVGAAMVFMVLLWPLGELREL